jgi:SAM-dependent methyltransferase
LNQRDWVLELKSRVKRNRRLATALFYLTDLLYLDLRERARFLRSFPAGARLVNLGAGFRSSPRGFFGLDREAYPGIGVVGELGRLPLRGASVDGILCEMVLEHVPDAAGALAEMLRVLRPGGRVYLALPFLWPYHASPHDYRRWSAQGVLREMAGFEVLAVGVSGGPTTALVNVAHEWLAMVLSLNVDALYRVAYLALIPLLYPLKLADHLLSRHRHAHKIAALIHVHGRKRPSGAPGA